MALTVTHPYSLTITEQPGSGTPGGVVGPTEWNATHTISGTLSSSQITAGINNQALITNSGTVPAWTTTGIFNVLSYGAVGDGVTDDTTAINNAIAAFNSAGVGALYFPATTGGYLVTAGLTTITALGIVQGQGGGNYIDTVNGAPTAFAASKIICNSTTAVVFSVNCGALTFRDLAIVNTASSTPTSTSRGIANTFAQLNPTINYYNIYVQGFYICVDVQVGAGWVMDGCQIHYPISVGLNITNTVNLDSGDWCVSNCVFSDKLIHATGIKQVGSGGGKIINSKFNAIGGGVGFVDCINSDLNGTSDLLISNVSFENFQDHAIRGHVWTNALISNIQTFGGGTLGGGGAGGTNGLIIYVNGGVNCVFNNLVINQPSAGSYAIRFETGNALQISISNVALVGSLLAGVVDPSGALPQFNEDYPVRVSANVPNSTASMADVTGLSAALQTLGVGVLVYAFEVYLSFTCAAAGGIQVQLVGSGLTATYIVYDGYIIDSGANGIKGNVHATSLGTVVASATTTGTAGVVIISGEIVPNAAGTLKVQFAQNTSNGTATTILKGSRMVVRRLPLGGG